MLFSFLIASVSTGPTSTTSIGPSPTPVNITNRCGIDGAVDHEFLSRGRVLVEFLSRDPRATTPSQAQATPSQSTGRAVNAIPPQFLPSFLASGLDLPVQALDPSDDSSTPPSPENSPDAPPWSCENKPPYVGSCPNYYGCSGNAPCSCLGYCNYNSACCLRTPPAAPPSTPPPSSPPPSPQPPPQPPSPPSPPSLPPPPPLPPLSPRPLLNLDGSPRIFKDGDSKAEITAFEYRPDAIIRMTATSNTTFELVNFVPVNLEDVELVMSFQGGAQNVYVARIESLPAHAIVELEYPFVTNPDGVFTFQENASRVDLKAFSAGVAPGEVSFDYRGTSTIMQRLERLKSVPWTLSLHDYNPTDDTNNWWVNNLTSRHGRLWTAHILNCAYVVTLSS